MKDAVRSPNVHAGGGGRYQIAFLLMLLFVGEPGQAHAQEETFISFTGQPTSHDLRFEPASLTGFDPFRFGMSQAQVEQVLASNWPGSVPQHDEDPVQRTALLNVNLAQLLPVPALGVASPGPATVTFVFGYRSGTLMAINLNWYAEGEATNDQRQALLAAGSAYVAEMLSYHWEMLQSARGHVIGDNALMLFAGRDTLGRGVEVRVEGVALDVLRPDGSTVHRPVAGGPAQLHIGLSAMPDNPDIFRLPENSF